MHPHHESDWRATADGIYVLLRGYIVMNLSVFRSAVDNWLQSVLRVDAFDLDKPPAKTTVIDEVAYPANRVIRYPISDASINVAMSEIEFTMNYDIIYRYRKNLAYHDLPLVDLEVAWLNLTHRLTKELPSLGANRVIVLDTEVGEPIGVTVTETNTDWLCSIQLQFRCILRYALEPIPNTLQPPATDSESLGINQVHLDAQLYQEIILKP